MEWQLCPTQSGDDKFLTAIHHNGVVTTDEHGVVFRSPNHIFCRLNKDITFPLLKEKVERKIFPEGTPRKEVKRIRYRIVICQDDGSIQYDSMEIRNDDEVRTMMELHANVPMGRQILELYVDTINSAEGIMHLLREPPPRPPRPAPVERYLVDMYCPGRLKEDRYGTYFDGPLYIAFLSDKIKTLKSLHERLLEIEEYECGGGRSHQMEIISIYYRKPRIRHGFPVEWSAYEINDDETVKIMFLHHKRSQEWTRRSMEIAVEVLQVLRLDT